MARKWTEDNVNILTILSDLRREREQLDEAIVSLERLAHGRERRRGRPPSWLKEPKRRGRPPGSKTKTAGLANKAAGAA
jgi:hypothetical protein